MCWTKLSCLLLRGDPEVGALVARVLASDLAELVDGAEPGLPPERRVRQHQRRALVLGSAASKRVADVDQRGTVRLADAVQQQVHLRPAGRCRATSSTPEIPPDRRCCASSLVRLSAWCCWM